jgi:outer membrane protein assembly factor BamB
MCILAFVLMLAPALGQSAEELFDTKAATQHTEKGIAHLKAKNYDAAAKEFEESSAISPDAEAFYYLGYAYYMKGKISNDGESRKKSMENFDKAYELNPNFTPSSSAFLQDLNQKADVSRQKRSSGQQKDLPEEPAASQKIEAQPPVQETLIDAIFRANNQRTGVYNTTGVPDVQKKEKWWIGTSDRIFATPAVVTNTIYVTDKWGDLSAYDVANGKKKWVHKAIGGGASSPAIANNTIFTGDKAGFFTAFDLKTQKRKWKFKAGSFIESSPAIYNGTVYFGSSDTNLYALDMETGNERWRFKSGGQINSSPAISDGLLFFGADEDHFYALDALTGKMKWKLKVSGFARSTPAVSDGLAFFKTGKTIQSGLLHAVDVMTGQEKWRIETLKNYKPGDIELIRSYNSGTPEDMDSSLPGYISSPAIASGLVYFGSGDGHLYAVDLQTGEEKWKFETGKEIVTVKGRGRYLGLRGIVSSPVICEGIVYFGTMNGMLFALDAGTGQERWKFSVGVMISSPVVADGVIYAGTIGRLYALH